MAVATAYDAAPAPAPAPTSLLPSLPSISLITSFFTGVLDYDSNFPDTPKSSQSTASLGLKSAIRASDSTEFAPPSPLKSVMFERASDDYLAVRKSTSELSVTSSTGNSQSRKRKRSLKPRTCYTLCQPPPKAASKRKIHVRARTLLQLHKVEAQGRPTPTFDVLPHAFSPRLIKAIAKDFGGTKHSLCYADCAIVKADKYQQDDEASTDSCCAEDSGDILALICRGRKGEQVANGHDKIYFPNGVEWDAYQLPSGGYECSTTDAHGLKRTVRWVAKKELPKDAASVNTTAVEDSRRFKFSTISPSSRRHPVIANLTKTTLEVYDTYTMPSPVSTPNIETPPRMTRASSEDTLQSGQPSISTTDDLRRLIGATSVWVALRENWCPTYRYDEMQRSASTKTVNSFKRPMSPPDSPHRTATMTSDMATRGPSMRQLSKVTSLLRRSLTRDELERPMSSYSTNSAFSSGSVLSGPVAKVPTRRGRADTTSTVLVHHGATQWRPDFGRARANSTQDSGSYFPERDVDEDDLTEEEGDLEQAVAGGESAEPLPSIEVTPKPAARQRGDLPGRNRPQSRNFGSSSTQTTDEISAFKNAASVKKGKGKRFSKLFCGML